MRRALPWEKRVFVVAEAGVNHNGDLRLAKKLIDAGARAGVDAVKFQTWRPGEIVGAFCHKVGYVEKASASRESMEELIARLCLPFAAFRELKAHAKKRGVGFLSTPDGFESLAFLAGKLAMPLIKVGSTEVTHPQFLEAVGRYGRPVILSTGMSDLAEVRAAVAALRRRGRPPIVLLHCTSEYPAPVDEVNVRAMVTLREAFGLPVGLSDHSLGSEAAIAAVALGACVVEKHFTLDRSLPGPDHASSLDPGELAALVASIRKTERLLGDGKKRMTPSEKRNVTGIRRSVVAARPLAKGTVLAATMLACLRPGTGIAPADLDRVVGMRLVRDLEQDEPLTWRHVRP
jgi:N-acetylneuraminate synthase/N,N'-diacetyllegionaminate synthase